MVLCVSEGGKWRMRTAAFMSSPSLLVHTNKSYGGECYKMVVCGSEGAKWRMRAAVFMSSPFLPVHKEVLLSELQQGKQTNDPRRQTNKKLQYTPEIECIHSAGHQLGLGFQCFCKPGGKDGFRAVAASFKRLA